MDLAVRNGVVYRDGTVSRATVGVRDGCIETVGDEDIAADRTVDADGGLVLPGLVNAHTHSPMTLFRGYADDLPFETWLYDRIMPAEAQLTREDVIAGARLAALEMIQTGTTAFADMYFQMDGVADVAEQAGLRAVLGPGVIVEEGDEDSAAGRIEEVAAFAAEYDGAADGRVRTMVTPHAPYSCPDEVLTALSSRAADVNRPYHIHVNETVEEVERLREAYGTDPILHLDDLGVLDEEAYIAHGVHLSDDEIRTLADRGTGVAHCPAANAKLGAGIAPIDALVDAGVSVCLGTDGAASNTLDVETVIEMATVNGADALGIDGGRIESGQPADLVVVDTDEPHLTPNRELLSHVVYAVTGRDVVTTIVDGRVLMDDGTVETMDADQVLADAERALSRVVSG